MLVPYIPSFTYVYPLVYVNCTTEAITFAIYPTVGDGKFNGTLIVMGKEIDTTCDPYPNVKILADAARKGRSATIRFDECGNATRFVMVGVEPPGANSNYDKLIII